MAGSTINQLIRNLRLRAVISGLSLLLCMFTTYYFLVVLKTAVIYTHLFYVPIVLTSAWWGRKGVILASCIVMFLLIINFYFAPNISIIDNLVRSAILLFVSILTSAIFVNRKRTEDKLRFHKEFNERVVNAIGDALLVIDPSDYRIIRANEVVSKQFKLREEEFIGKTCHEATHHRSTPCTPPHDVCPIQELLKTGEPVTVEHQHFDEHNNRTYVEVTVHPVKDKEGKTVQVVHIAKDITERKKAEEKLKESEEKYETTFESSMDALMLLDERGFLDCNTSSLLLFGCKTAEEFTKYHPADLSPPKQPDGSPSMEAAINHINRALKTGTDSFFWMHKRTDGTTFPADVLLTRMPLKDRNVLQATARDITERKEAEEKLKENSERIEMMNEKLRVVSSLTKHDVRNKLSAVTGYAYLLKNKHADQADIVDGLGKMEQAVKEVGKIFDFARMYEQLGVEELTYVDVEKTLDEAAALFSGLTIKVVNGCHGLTVLADSFLRQLFYNFIDNTRKYGGKATAVRGYYEKAELDGLRLVYEDDGAGISAESKLKLFTEGFSTGGSTGFGLFLIRKMMDVYGWQIQETGEPGKGAKFVITIPRVNQGGKENFQTAK